MDVDLKLSCCNVNLSYYEAKSESHLSKLQLHPKVLNSAIYLDNTLGLIGHCISAEISPKTYLQEAEMCQILHISTVTSIPMIGNLLLH